jgi:hypothetical protein
MQNGDDTSHFCYLLLLSSIKFQNYTQNFMQTFYTPQERIHVTTIITVRGMYYPSHYWLGRLAPKQRRLAPLPLPCVADSALLAALVGMAALGGDLRCTTNLKKPVPGLSRPAHAWRRQVVGATRGPRSVGGEGGGRLCRAACQWECYCCCYWQPCRFLWQLEPKSVSS